ncbi:OadG family transporter subunit [Vagococcus salmoninarum]|uniref:OadG family transporter subunit n=1 Tax=Vagococcus salmoninarum TaxID=2739 RepID=UPI00187F2713|nr:OadG family transporter subunit [Vagococcus salmoninarum]MBE9389594.1 OadG family protein [Vagococcus salmoninarum]
MTEISITEAVMISIGCIITVFIVLIGLQIIMTMFKYLKNDEVAVTTVKAQPVMAQQQTTLETDQETEEVAMLMALVLANDNQQDKKYEIANIKRLK